MRDRTATGFVSRGVVTGFLNSLNRLIELRHEQGRYEKTLHECWLAPQYFSIRYPSTPCPDSLGDHASLFLRLLTFSDHHLPVHTSASALVYDGLPNTSDGVGHTLVGPCGLQAGGTAPLMRILYPGIEDLQLQDAERVQVWIRIWGWERSRFGGVSME